MISARCLAIVLTCLAVSGCYVNTYGGQTVGGTTTTATSTQVGAMAKFSAGTASFSSGQPVSPAAPGSRISLTRSGGLVAAAVLVVAEAVQYVGDLFQPGPPAAGQGYSIADTCSCYRNSYEVTK